MEFEEFEDYDLSIDEIDEIKEIASQIRRTTTITNLCVAVNKHHQIVLELEIEKCETMYSIMNIMNNIKEIQAAYMPDFDCLFEMWMYRQKPVIYCTYERYKTN
jgi:hypothetical protein